MMFRNKKKIVSIEKDLGNKHELLLVPSRVCLGQVYLVTLSRLLVDELLLMLKWSLREYNSDNEKSWEFFFAN